MVFTSTEFLIFFPLVVGLFFVCPVRAQWILLLIASYVFAIATRPVYGVLLAVSTLSFYLAAIAVDTARSEGHRRWILATGIGMNLVMLFAFKYYNFFEGQFNMLADQLGLRWRMPVLNVLLPMGISFYTFQGISYLVDVYRRDMPAERHLGLVMLYKAFFPQLVAGPIERGTRFLPQLRHHLLDGGGSDPIRFEYPRAVSGLRLMLLGFFKKLVVADNCGLIVQPVYETPAEFSGPSAVVATLAFALQIYFDFSAYTDIARGCARVLGFELVENFRQPYFARDIADFWQRWHISLSSWFRDYLYIPLGGNRVPKSRWFLNLWIVFLLCGLWHGANCTFLVWGILHGFYYFLFHAIGPAAAGIAAFTRLSRLPRLCDAIRIGFTFALVCWAWVMFRADTLGQAVEVWKKMAGAPMTLIATGGLLLRDGQSARLLEALGLEWLFRYDGRLSLLPLYVAGFAAGSAVVSRRLRNGGSEEGFATWATGTRWACYFLAIAAILVFGRFGSSPFIYFQF